MWLSIVGLWLLYAAQLAAANCNHDNCLRDVIASAFPTRHGSADCTSYFRTTVVTGPIPKSTITPSNIPAYASDCSGSVRYSSACSCVGAVAATITAPATISGYPFKGCYQDTDSPYRILEGLPYPYYIGPQAMSNEYCAAYCSGHYPIQPHVYSYFGTEDAAYCLCGNSIDFPALNTPAPGSCTTTCSGTPTETCGAAAFIDVWGSP